MKISLIVAMGQNREIGYQNQIPWKLKADLQNFKALTMGHHIVMGRKTFESIGRPLPGRKTIILSKDLNLSVPNCDVVSDLEDAYRLAKSRGETELFVAGGAQVYAMALPEIDRLYLTKVAYSGKADTFFPDFDSTGWKQVKSECHPEQDGQPSWQFEILQRKEPL